MQIQPTQKAVRLICEIRHSLLALPVWDFGDSNPLMTRRSGPSGKEMNTKNQTARPDPASTAGYHSHPTLPPGLASISYAYDKAQAQGCAPVCNEICLPYM